MMGKDEREHKPKNGRWPRGGYREQNRGPRRPAPVQVSDVAPPGAQRELGVVVSVHADKGFGFIRANDGGSADGKGTMRFFHKSACRGRLERYHPGERVSFVATQGTKGPRAILVQKEGDQGEGEGEVGDAEV